MDSHFAANGSATPPTAPVAPNITYPTDGNPLAPTPATEPGEWWFHSVTQEFLAVIVAAGLTPAWNVLTQLRDALYALFGRLASVNVWTKAQRGAYVTLTSTAGSTAMDLAAANHYYHLFTENTVLAAPTNSVEGTEFVIDLEQHASAAKTLGFNSYYKFADGLIPAVSTTVGAKQKLFGSVDKGGASATCALMNARS